MRYSILPPCPEYPQYALWDRQAKKLLGKFDTEELAREAIARVENGQDAVPFVRTPGRAVIDQSKDMFGNPW